MDSVARRAAEARITLMDLPRATRAIVWEAALARLERTDDAYSVIGALEDALDFDLPEIRRTDTLIAILEGQNAGDQA